MPIRKQQLELDMEQQTGSKEEAQAGIKIAGRNIDNLRNADDTTLVAET